jgi:hypothetical protein
MNTGHDPNVLVDAGASARGAVDGHLWPDAPDGRRPDRVHPYTRTVAGQSRHAARVHAVRPHAWSRCTVCFWSWTRRGRRCLEQYQIALPPIRQRGREQRSTVGRLWRVMMPRSPAGRDWIRMGVSPTHEGTPGFSCDPCGWRPRRDNASDPPKAVSCRVSIRHACARSMSRRARIIRSSRRVCPCATLVAASGLCEPRRERSSYWSISMA